MLRQKSTLVTNGKGAMRSPRKAAAKNCRAVKYKATSCTGASHSGYAQNLHRWALLLGLTAQHSPIIFTSRMADSDALSNQDSIRQ